MIEWKKSFLYVLISFILWVLVEFVTVWYSRFEEWMSYMPFALFQYLFIILIFWLFLFVFKWKHSRVFFVMILIMYVFEFLWQNFLILNLVWFVPVSALLIQVWGFLTFVPYWLVKKEIKRNKRKVLFYCLWPVLAFFLALFL